MRSIDVRGSAPVVTGGVLVVRPWGLGAASNSSHLRPLSYHTFRHTTVRLVRRSNQAVHEAAECSLLVPRSSR